MKVGLHKVEFVARSSRSFLVLCRHLGERSHSR
jgi:hypothetical protein